MPLSEPLVGLPPVTPGTHMADALQFFFYNSPKVLLLLTGVVFLMGNINSWLEKVVHAGGVPNRAKVEGWF